MMCLLKCKFCFILSQISVLWVALLLIWHICTSPVLLFINVLLWTHHTLTLMQILASKHTLICMNSCFAGACYIHLGRPTLFLPVFLWGRHTKADLLTVLHLLRMLMNREVRSLAQGHRVISADRTGIQSVWLLGLSWAVPVIRIQPILNQVLHPHQALPKCELWWDSWPLLKADSSVRLFPWECHIQDMLLVPGEPTPFSWLFPICNIRSHLWATSHLQMLHSSCLRYWDVHSFDDECYSDILLGVR